MELTLNESRHPLNILLQSVVDGDRLVKAPKTTFKFLQYNDHIRVLGVANGLQ